MSEKVIFNDLDEDHTADDQLGVVGRNRDDFGQFEADPQARFGDEGGWKTCLIVGGKASGVKF